MLNHLINSSNNDEQEHHVLVDVYWKCLVQKSTGFHVAIMPGNPGVWDFLDN